MTWSPEIALLLDATSIHPDEEAVLRIRQRVERGLDWSELLRIAIPHGVLPLLSHNLSVHAASVVPPVTLAQLQLFGKSVAERNREQSLELVKLVSAFSRVGIRVISFKGPALAISSYGDISLRESHDLDLWVDPLQLARANEWFCEAGYHPLKHVKGAPREVSDPSEADGEFSSPNRSVLVEVRAHLEQTENSYFDPPFEQAWSRRRLAFLEGFDIPVLGIEDLILGLAVHGSKHAWRRLNWIADIAGLIYAHPEIDWGGMSLRAGEWRCRRQLLTAVTLASSLYSVELPPLVRKAAQEQAVRSAVAHICSRLFRRECRTIASVTSDFLYRFRCYDSASSRLRFVRNWLGCLVQADENRILLPMSKNLSRVHRAAAALRSCWAQAKAGERPSPRPSQGETKDEAAQ